MSINEIIKFLESKPGYRKEGARRLARILKGNADIDDCSTALLMFNRRLTDKKVKEGLKVKEGQKVLIYDIETSYNIVSAWRVGYKVMLPHYSVIKERAIICVSYKWLGEDEVYNLSWDKNQCDKFLLEQFIEVMNEADVLVAHNGDRFDLPWMKTRALKHDLEMLPTYNQIYYKILRL
jgi:DNA polymerase elongation subunit (family B)